MSYFYPFEVSLSIAHRNLLRRGVMHMWPCAHMQIHFLGKRISMEARKAPGVR